MRPIDPAGAAQSGFISNIILRLFLLFVVLSELTYLASRYNVRADLTGDQRYTLTESTSTVLGKLDELLVIEAYFSPKTSLPILAQPRRAELVNMLDDYERLGAGKVRVQYIDPTQDRRARETAERLGIRAQPTRVSGAGGSIITTELWQGLRLRYGGQKQEVIPLLPLSSTAEYERRLTPMIKRLTVIKRPKIGVLSFRSQPGGRGMVISMEEKTQPQGFMAVMRHPEFNKEYELVPLDIRKGQLIPEDIGIAMLIRPKFLGDRTKFIFDQFLMRGGKLVVFVDTSECEVRPDRALRLEVVSYDSQVAKLRFEDMLLTYGVKIANRIVADGVSLTQQLFADTHLGQWAPISYPYMFEARDEDWGEFAAKNLAPDDVLLAAQYRKNFKNGMNVEHDLIKGLLNVGAPGFFWPCPVDLADELPQGVTGEVLLRTSPLSWIEPPNMQPVDPFNEIGELQQRYMSLERWTKSMQNRRPVTSPMQTSLMVHLEGTFPSFFADKEVPLRPADEAQKKAAKKAEEDEEWGTEKAPKKAGEKTQKKPGEAGPEPARAKPAAVVEEDKLTRAQPAASLLVIGDATFLRDDFVRGLYREPNQAHRIPVVGPVDREMRLSRPLLFFKNLLDWLAQERDLLALRSKIAKDRTMTFLERNETQGETQEEFLERLISRQFWIQISNIGVPAILLAVFGLIVLIRRRIQKRVFLASL